MSASTHIGRIGALAAALGTGAVMLTGPAVAWADRGPSDSTESSSADAAGVSGSASEQSTPPPARGSRIPRPALSDEPALAPAPRAGRSAVGDLTDAAPEAAAAVVPDAPRRERGSDTPIADPQPAAVVVQSDSAGTTSVNARTTAVPADVEPVSILVSQPAPADGLLTVAATAAHPVASVLESTPPVALSVPPAPANATVSDRISAAVTSFVSRLADSLGQSPFAPPAGSPAEWLLLAAARRQPAAATTTATAAATAGTSTGPTLLVLDGYKVVAASKKLVTSFYGPFVNFPAYPGIQSEQRFNLVDPATNKVVGSFNALQSEFTAIGTTRQLVVTDILSGNAGTVAPVGTVISSTDNFGFGTLYTAKPLPSGNSVSFSFVTPFFSVPVPFPYDAAKGLTDYVEVNKPLSLPGTGYSIAPTTPSTEEFTSVTGFQPLFTAIQGRQDYSVYDRNGVAVGGFEGLVTTTSDVLGLYTKEILVTKVGPSTNPNVPPVGTVYNIINFTDDFYVLYSSSPSASGTVTSTRLVTPLGPVTIPLNFDAATPPPQKPLQVPGGYKFVPTSAAPIVGVNGLPPREMITQGYQQFDVVDFLGNKLGSVDADVTRQWDWFGGTSNAILITKVTAGAAGPLPWNVPPVGSVFNFRQPFGVNLGFSDYYSSIPTILGDVVTYGTVTPFGLLPLFLPNYLSAGLRDAEYVNPFAVTA